MAEYSVANDDDYAEIRERIMQAHIQELDRSLAEPSVDQETVERLFNICSTDTLSELQVALLDLKTTEAALAIQERRTEYIKRKLYNLLFMVERACKVGNAAIVEFLLEFAKTHDVPSSKVIERGTVNVAIESNDLSTFMALAASLPHVIEFDLGPGGGHPLDKTVGSARNGIPYGDTRTPLLAFLLENGADPNKPTGARMHRLGRAAGAGSLTAVRLLLQHGATIAGSGALHMAAKNGKVDVLELLLEHGANINELLGDEAASEWYSERGQRQKAASMTALQFAVQERQVEAIEWLNKHGTDANINRIIS